MTFSLTQAIRDALAREKLGFHMPGHAGGRGLPDWLPRAAGLLATTELPHTDNLAQPETMLRAAPGPAAPGLGAAPAQFMGNGAPRGHRAMVQATVGPVMCCWWDGTVIGPSFRRCGWPARRRCL